MDTSQCSLCQECPYLNIEDFWEQLIQVVLICLNFPTKPIYLSVDGVFQIIRFKEFMLFNQQQIHLPLFFSTTMKTPLFLGKHFFLLNFMMNYQLIIFSYDHRLLFIAKITYLLHYVLYYLITFSLMVLSYHLLLSNYHRSHQLFEQHFLLILYFLWYFNFICYQNPRYFWKVQICYHFKFLIIINLNLSYVIL